MALLEAPTADLFESHDSLVLTMESLDARLAALERAKSKSALAKITENAGAIALFLGLVLTLASLRDVFLVKPEADRIARISQFNQAVNSAARIRQEVLQSQLSPGEPGLKVAMASAATPRILNDLHTARAILRDMRDADVGIPQLIVLISESFTAGDLPSAHDFVTRAVNKTDASPFLRAEAKRYQAKFLYATGNPDQGRHAYQQALQLIGDSPISAAARAYDVADWIVLEFTYGDCPTASALLSREAPSFRSPVIGLEIRRQISGALVSQLEQVRGGRCALPDDLRRLLEV